MALSAILRASLRRLPGLHRLASLRLLPGHLVLEVEAAGITALGLIWARRLSAGDPRRMLAAMTAAFGGGQVVGPTFAGGVHDATGSFVLPSLAAAGALVVASALAARVPEEG